MSILPSPLTCGIVFEEEYISKSNLGSLVYEPMFEVIESYFSHSS